MIVPNHRPMFINEKDAQRRLTSQNNLINSLNVEHRPMPHPHRGPAVPDFLKVLTGTLAHTERTKDVAKAFDLDKQTVSGYKHGKVGGDVNPELTQKIGASVERIREIAVEKLMQSLGLITTEKMQKMTARDISTVAKNMSAIVSDHTQREVAGSGAQVIIYSPQIREEAKFKVIEVE